MMSSSSSASSFFRTSLFQSIQPWEGKKRNLERQTGDLSFHDFNLVWNHMYIFKYKTLLYHLWAFIFRGWFKLDHWPEHNCFALGAPRLSRSYQHWPHLVSLLKKKTDCWPIMLIETTDIWNIQKSTSNHSPGNILAFPWPFFCNFLKTL